MPDNKENVNVESENDKADSFDKEKETAKQESEGVKQNEGNEDVLKKQKETD